MKLSLFIVALGITFQSFSQTTWSVTNSGISNTKVKDMAVGPNGDAYLIGYHYDYIYSKYRMDLFKSTNQGTSWVNLNVPTPTGIDIPISIIFSGTKLLMSGTNASGTYSVYTSTNYGQSWTNASTGIPAGYELNDLAVAPNGIIFMASSVYNGFGVYFPKLLKSTNGGTSWTNVVINNTTNFNSTAIFIDSQSRIYLAGSSLTTSNWMYTSTNYGSTWTLSNTGINSFYEVGGMTHGNGQEIFAVCSEIVDVGEFNIKTIRSPNSGASWAAVAVSGMAQLTEPKNALINSNGKLLLMGQGPDYVYRKALPSAPVVLTTTVTDVHDVTASALGQVTIGGNAPPLSRGFCWNTSPNPGISNFTVDAGTGTGTFVATISELTPLTTYYLKAFATNSVGTSYGSEITFTTDIASGIRSFDKEIISAIYPIPSSDFIYFDATKKAGYAIYDLVGKLVLQGIVEEGKNAINLTGLARGGYFFQVENAEKRKILKQ